MNNPVCICTQYISWAMNVTSHLSISTIYFTVMKGHHGQPAMKSSKREKCNFYPCQHFQPGLCIKVSFCPSRALMMYFKSRLSKVGSRGAKLKPQISFHILLEPKTQPSPPPLSLCLRPNWLAEPTKNTRHFITVQEYKLTDGQGKLRIKITLTIEDKTFTQESMMLCNRSNELYACDNSNFDQN